MKWSDSLAELAASLSLYANTPLTDALSLPASVARRFFDGNTFEGWRKGREAESKMQAAIVSRLNDVIRACGIVAKTVANRSR